MNFDTVRWGWPNVAAIAALAILPVVMLAPSAARQPQIARTTIDAPVAQAAMHAAAQTAVE